MRRTSGPQAGSTFLIRKDTTNKNKSPQVFKPKSRGKIGHESGATNSIMSRKVNSFSKGEANQSSTFFTTQNNKTKKSFPESKKGKELKKYEKQIMEVLHKSASIIQREWRKYLIRKYKKQLELKNKKVEPIYATQQPQFDSVSGRTSQCSQVYNNKKYYSCEQSGSKKQHENSFNKNVFSFNLSEVKVTKISLSPEKASKNEVKRTQKLQFLPSIDIRHNRTRSDQAATTNNHIIKIEQKQEQRNLEIKPKIVDIVIDGNRQKSQEILHQARYQDHFIKKQKGSLDQILSKLQSKLEQKKLKKILALENSFSSNQMTFRSYKKNMESVDEQHQKKISLLEIKKKKIMAKLNQFVGLIQKNEELALEDQEQHQIYREKSRYTSKEHGCRRDIKQEDEKQLHSFQKQLNKIPVSDHHALDISFNEELSGFQSRSIAFDDWDLDAQFSEKKVSSKQQLTQRDKKSSEILIYDNQRQNTLINELTENQLIAIEEDNIHNEPDNKQTRSHQLQSKQVIFNTPPKHAQNRCEKIESLVQNLKPDSLPPLSRRPQPPVSGPAEVIVQGQPISENNRKLRSEEEVEQELLKFHPIKPNIDIVNNWLLQVSHFILDNFGNQFLRKLVHIQQPPSHQIWKACLNKQPYFKEYLTISQKIFKQFQFFHIKTLLNQEKVQNQKKQAYSALMYTFHQALYDCLNRMLLDELIEGRNWLNYPWSSQFKPRKLVPNEHSKQCLQKSINRVSNISDYNISPIDPNIQIGRQFEQTQHNLIFAEEIKQIPLTSQMERGYLIYLVSQAIQTQIFEEELQLFMSL